MNILLKFHECASPSDPYYCPETVETCWHVLKDFLAPAVLLTLWFLPIPGLAPKAHQLLAVLGAVVTLWLSEAIPMAVTALLGPALCVVLNIAPAREVFRGFGDPILFLYLGGFFIAEAMLHH